MLQDLLAYSRIGTHIQAFAEVDCQAVLEQVLQDLRSALEDKNAKVTQDPLPTVWGDETQLVQLFQNLVDNALKYQDQESPQIHIAASPNDERWVFSIKDNGIGTVSGEDPL